MTKRKEQRRELLKEDEFLSFVEKAIKYAQDNSKRVLTITAIVVVGLIVIFGGLRLWERSREQNAEALYQAEKIMDTDLEDPNADLKFETETAKFEAAIEALDQVIDSQSGAIRDQAIIRKIACLMNLGRQLEVEPLYRQLAESRGAFDGLGEIGLGDFYAAQGEYDQALDHYNKALTRQQGTAYEDLIHLKMAQSFKDKGDLTTARVEIDALMAKLDAQPQEQRSPLYQKAKDLQNTLGVEEEAEDLTEAS